MKGIGVSLYFLAIRGNIVSKHDTIRIEPRMSQ